MSERAHYARVYFEVIDDPRFEGIYDDDRHFATWVRLLMGAEAKWPASADLPATARRSSVKVLVDKGIVELQPGGRYRIHGLDKERRRRADKAKDAADTRWSNARSNAQSNADASATTRALTSRAKPSIDEPSKEASIEERLEVADKIEAEAVAVEEWDVFESWYELTGRPPLPNTPVREWLFRLGERFGHRRASISLATEFKANPERRDLLSRTQRRLEAEDFEAERAEKRDEKRRNAAKRAPVRILPPPDDISDEEAERIADSLLSRGSA